jgi:DDB1- and CUL4-associated factor 13
MDDWKYIYVERANSTESLEGGLTDNAEAFVPAALQDPRPSLSDPDHGLTKRRGVDWETPPVRLPSTTEYKTYASLPHPCNQENPRIFHMFWTGPFTDKPYLALLSFLYTQNTGLHTHEYPAQKAACRPQFWLWINPGPAASELKETATKDMYDSLRSSPWAAPFLHPRFQDVIHFKLWNTTEQLDGVPELRDHWRSSDTLFNSGGHVINVPSKKDSSQGSDGPINSTSVREDDMMNRAGSKSSSSYDRLSVILSDMARFILCHRFGGIYLDADTLFLRDCE